MGVVIKQEQCVGCGRCLDICPGNLIRMNKLNKAYLKHPADCWSCVSCMKECQTGAIVLILPPEIEGRGSILTVHRSGSNTEWTVIHRDGDRKVLVTSTDEANRY